MAQAPRTFAIDFNRGLISGSPSFETSYAFKPFYNGDSDAFRVYIVSPGATPGSLVPQSTTGLSLKIALGVWATGSNGTAYTSVTLSADSSGTWFEGVLPLNVAAVNNLFASQSAAVSVKFEAELEDDGKHTFETDTVIRQQIIGTSLVDTPAPDTAMGIQQARGEFFPLVDGTEFIMIDSDGTGRRYRIRIYDANWEFTHIGT